MQSQKIEEREVGETTLEPMDPVGSATLELFEVNDGYNQLIWDRMRSLGALGGRVLEIGCGTGNLSRLMLAESGVEALHCIDVDDAYVRRVRDEIDDPRFEAFCVTAGEFRPAGDLYDSAVSINVIEHIEDDVEAVRAVERALVPGGEFWILVPAHPWLYSQLDAGLSHYRRYTRASLATLAEKAGLVPERLFHFNPIGALGWFFHGKVRGRPTLTEGTVSLYNRYFLPVSRLIDCCNPFPFGLSLIARLRKPQ